jgi:hypothetical protein
MAKENGSLLVLTLIAVLILSLLMIGLLTVGTTELQSTQNFQLNKSAYYAAVQGVEEVRNEIYNDPAAAGGIIKSKSETGVSDTFGDIKVGTSRAYITGTHKDWEENTPQNIKPFEGFKPPGASGISMGLVKLKVWKVTITAEARMGNRASYAEIEAGIYSFITGYK